MAQPDEDQHPDGLGRDCIPIRPEAGKRHDRQVAEVLLDGVTGAAAAAHHFATDQVEGGLSLRDTVDALRDLSAAQPADAADGLERMLRAQATTLSVIFSELTKRAARHLDSGSTLNLDSYLRLAFRAQDQARRTAETLSTLRSPGVVIAKNVNQNHGVQQIISSRDSPLYHHDHDSHHAPVPRLDA